MGGKNIAIYSVLSQSPSFISAMLQIQLSSKWLELRSGMHTWLRPPWKCLGQHGCCWRAYGLHRVVMCCHEIWRHQSDAIFPRTTLKRSISHEKTHHHWQLHWRRATTLCLTTECRWRDSDDRCHQCETQSLMAQLPLPAVVNTRITQTLTYQWCGLRPSVFGQDRSETKKIGIGLGLAGLMLCCETKSCHARRHNDLEGHSNFSSTIYSFSMLCLEHHYCGDQQ